MHRKLEDQYDAKVRQAIDALLKQRGHVAPIEVFVHMGYLTPEAVTDWRFGRVPFLEKAIGCNLSKVSRIMQTLRRLAEGQMKLRPSMTVYRRWGKGRKEPLRFSKSGLPKIEAPYSTHWLSEKPAKAANREADDLGGRECRLPHRAPDRR